MEKLNTILCDVFRLKKDELKDELTMKDIKKKKNLIKSILKDYLKELN